MPTAAPVPPPVLATEAGPDALSCCCRATADPSAGPLSSSELRVSESPKRKLEEGEEAQSLNEDSGFLSSSLRVSKSAALWRGGGSVDSLTCPSFREQSEGPACWLLRFLRPESPLSESLRPPASRRGLCLVSPHSGVNSLPALPITSMSAGKLLAVSIGSGFPRGPFRGSCLRRVSGGTSLFIVTDPRRMGTEDKHSSPYVSMSSPAILFTAPTTLVDPLTPCQGIQARQSVEKCTPN